MVKEIIIVKKYIIKEIIIQFRRKTTEMVLYE